MSKRIRERLAQLNIQDTTHEERLALDLEIERLTGVWCDIGNDQLTDQQFRDALARIREQLKRKKKQEQQNKKVNNKSKSKTDLRFQNHPVK